MSRLASTPDRYYPALDGLRALATVAVLISHFFPEQAAIQRVFHWGRFGVLLFFVLSGFLITGLLLRGREAAESGSTTRGAVFRRFVVRRALRIAPIYYLVVLIGWWAGYRPVAEFLAWHLTYTGNIAMTYFGARMAQATHLWSLCVEEQFYLIWPLVILWAPAKRLAAIALALVIYSFGHEAVGALNGRTFEQTHLVLQGCMDALGLGALLAICARSAERGAPVALSARGLAITAASVGVPLLFIAQIYRYRIGILATDQFAYRLIGDMGLACASLLLVYVGTFGPAWLRLPFELAPVRYIGRISYGIYLYHLFLIAIGRFVARGNGVPELDRGLTMFVLYTTISVAVAALSWHLLENPINRQKRRFPYPPTRPSTEALAQKTVPAGL